MKKIILLILITLLLTGFSFAQTIDEPLFAPVFPEIIAQGGAFTANAHGYGALITNPAGFSMKGGSFTLLSANMGSYFLPDEAAMNGIDAMMNGSPESGIALLSDIITSNGIGANINTGIGIVGKGIGLGLIVDLDTYGRGKTALGSSFDGAVTATGIAGYSLKLGTDNFAVHVGGDLRLMHRIKMENVAILDLVGASPAFNVRVGNALAMDLGAILKMGTLSVGLSLRDIGGTPFMYTDPVSVDDPAFDPMGSGAVDTYRIPMQGTLGVSYNPDFGGFSFLIDPTFSLDYQHIFYKDPDYTPSFWTGLHAGTEIKVLRFMKVRAGINQGYVTAGIGAKVLFMDVNIAYFTREMSEYAGVEPNSGVTMEMAIRF